MKKEDFNSVTCSVARALMVIGGKWSLRVIDEIGTGKKRFGELKRGIPEISEKMLIQELKLLTQNEVLERKSYHEVPPRVEYSLTDLGLQLLPILEQIKDFGNSLLEHSINKSQAQ